MHNTFLKENREYDKCPVTSVRVKYQHLPPRTLNQALQQTLLSYSKQVLLFTCMNHIHFKIKVLKEDFRSDDKVTSSGLEKHFWKGYINVKGSSRNY